MSLLISPYERSLGSKFYSMMDKEYMITSPIRKPLPQENHFLSHQENLNKIKQEFKPNFNNSIIILVHTFKYIYIYIVKLRITIKLFACPKSVKKHLNFKFFLK